MLGIKEGQGFKHEQVLIVSGLLHLTELSTLFFHLTYAVSSAKRSYVIPLVVAIAVFAVFVAVIVFVLKTRLQRQRNGRMKLTEHHADTLPHPYPEEKTFENPIYQVSEHLTEHRRHCHPSLSLTRPYTPPTAS